MPFKAYVLKARITTAQNILLFSDFPLAKIAAALGSSSQSAFSAAFRRQTGMTPTQYRSRAAAVRIPPERDAGMSAPDDRRRRS